MKLKTELLGKSFLLSNKQRNGLHFSKRASKAIIVNIGNEGNLSSNYNDYDTKFSIEDTLADIFLNELKLDEVTFDQIFKCLILPEMEIERIFNTIRYKYLKAVYQSNRHNPQECFDSTYNKAFQALAGLLVYQGNAAFRKDNDAFWKEAGFTKRSRNQNWDKEHNDLKVIIDLLKHIHAGNPEDIYAELIAIKPGFHELFIHEDYFSKEQYPNGTSPRDTVFRILKNKQKKSCFKLDNFPQEINKKSYFSYAPCSITEGPFVFRKDPSVTYVDEIKSITSKAEIKNLSEKFHILNYYNQDISTPEKLAELLEKAKFFLQYPG